MFAADICGKLVFAANICGILMYAADICGILSMPQSLKMPQMTEAYSFDWGIHEYATNICGKHEYDSCISL